MVSYKSYDRYIMKNKYNTYSDFSCKNTYFTSYASGATNYYNPAVANTSITPFKHFYNYFTGNNGILNVGNFFNSKLYSSSYPQVAGGYSYPFSYSKPLKWFRNYNTDFSRSTTSRASFSLKKWFCGISNNIKSLLPSKTSYSGSKTSSTSGTSHKTLKYKYSDINKDVQEKLGPKFLAKVKKVANNINCDYKDLLAIMNAESGLNPAKQNNAGHKMFGLIQFSEDSAKMLGTTHEKLVKMSAVEQMDYVEKYYTQWIKEKGWQGRKLSAADLYALTLAPGKAQNDVLYTKSANKKQYIANKGIDINFGNGDGKIDKSDCEAFIASKRVNELIFA